MMPDNFIDWEDPGFTMLGRRKLRARLRLRIILLVLAILFFAFILANVMYAASNRAVERNIGLRSVTRPDFPIPTFRTLTSKSLEFSGSYFAWKAATLLDLHLNFPEAPVNGLDAHAATVQFRTAITLHELKRAKILLEIIQQYVQDTSVSISGKVDSPLDPKSEIAEILTQIVLPAMAVEIGKKSWIRSSELSAIASKMLMLIDGDPGEDKGSAFLGYPETNAILFFEVLFDDLSIPYLYPEQFSSIAQILSSGDSSAFEEITSIGLATEKGTLVDFSTYISAMNSFRAHQFDDATKNLIALSNNTQNDPLRELALLLQARAIFWKFKMTPALSPEKTHATKTTRNDLNSILKKLKRKNYRSDVEYYIQRTA